MMKSRLMGSIGILLSLIAFTAFIGVPLDLQSQCVFAATLFAVSLLVGSRRSKKYQIVLIILTVLVSTRYLWWRATYTLDFVDTASAAAGYALFAAELYAYIVLLLGYLQSIRPLGRKPALLPEDTSVWPTVDVFIPTYNEPLHIVSATVAGAKNLEWPRDKLTVYLLDDGNRAEFRRYCAEAGVVYRNRSSNAGAKAGNLNEALKHSSGQLIAVFDSDQVPVRSFLQVTVGWFLKDRKIAQIQTPQYFYTADPIEKNLGIYGKVPNESSLFYGLIQDGNDLWNATYFCGSCAVLRRSALMEIGGFAEDTVTEDAHTSIKLHRSGYDSAYINEVQSAGMATDSLEAHIKQRIRWARGLAQVFRIDNPLLGRGLTLWQRLCYTNATIHFFYAAPRLIFLLAPLFFLFFDLSVIQADAAMVAAMALPHILQNNLAAARLSGHWRHAFWAEIYETVLSFYIFLPTLLALLSPKSGKFNVTRKGHSSDTTYFNYRLALPFITIGLLNLAAISVGLYRYFVLHNAEPSTTALNLFWAGYNLIITGAAIAVALETLQTRKFQRHSFVVPAVMSTGNGKRFATVTQNVSESGAHLRLDNSSQAVNPDDERGVVRLTLTGEHGLLTLPVKNITRVDGGFRVEFGQLDVRSHRKLILMLYSSADRWLGVREKLQSAGLLRSIGQVAFMGLLGWTRALSGMGRSRNRNPAHRSGSGRKALPLLCLLAVSCGGLLALGYTDTARAQEETVYELRQLTDRLESETDIGLVHYGLEIPFAIRRDTVVNSGELTLSMSWKGSTEARDEYLAVSINNRILWRSTEESASREIARIPFDGSLLTDYNLLKISLENSDPEQCRAGTGGSFSLVLHDDSEIRMDVSTIPIANDLDTLPFPFFDERDPRRATIDFVLPDSASEATLVAAARVAAWFGSLASYRSVEYRVTTDHVPDRNAIVVASGDSLPDSLKWLDTGVPRLLVLDNPDYPARQLLVLTAPDDSQLQSAVKLLLETGRSRTGTARPDSRTGSAPISLAGSVPFSSLPGAGGAGLSLVDNNFSPLSVPFQVPGDFHTGDGKPHRLHLIYRYSPDFPDFKESMYVSLNGRGIVEVDLEQQSAPGLIDRFRKSSADAGLFEGSIDINIPHEYVRSENSLEIRFSAPADVIDNCDGAFVTLVDAGIDGASTIDLSNGAIRARYPDLALFVNSGLPFTEYLDMRSTHVQLPVRAQPFHYALYLSLMGRIAAITGSEPSAVTVSRGFQPSGRSHRIVIAESSALADLNMNLIHSPLYLSHSGLAASFKSPASIYNAISDWINPLSVQEQLAHLRAGSDPRETGYIVSSRMPADTPGVLLVLLSDSEKATDSLQEIMTDPLRLRQVHGSAVVVNADSAESISVGRNLTRGHLPFVQTVWWWLRDNPFLMLVLVGVSSIVFSLSLSGFLDRVAIRRLEGRSA